MFPKYCLCGFLSLLASGVAQAQTAMSCSSDQVLRGAPFVSIIKESGAFALAIDFRNGKPTLLEPLQQQTVKDGSTFYEAEDGKFWLNSDALSGLAILEVPMGAVSYSCEKISAPPVTAAPARPHWGGIPGPNGECEHGCHERDYGTRIPRCYCP